MSDTIRVNELTDEDWDAVKEELKDILSGKRKPFIDPRPTEQGYEQPVQPCAIQRFFEQHPEVRVAAISCICPRCTTWCL